MCESFKVLQIHWDNNNTINNNNDNIYYLSRYISKWLVRYSRSEKRFWSYCALVLNQTYTRRVFKALEV